MNPTFNAIHGAPHSTPFKGSNVFFEFHTFPLRHQGRSGSSISLWFSCVFRRLAVVSIGSSLCRECRRDTLSRRGDSHPPALGTMQEVQEKHTNPGFLASRPLAPKPANAASRDEIPSSSNAAWQQLSLLRSLPDSGALTLPRTCNVPGCSRGTASCRRST